MVGQLLNSKCRRFHKVCSCDDDCICSGDIPKRLAQLSGGKNVAAGKQICRVDADSIEFNVAVAKRICRVDTDNIEISFRTPMLEPVIQNKGCYSEFFLRPRGSRDTIGICDDDRLSYQLSRQLHWLITAGSRIDEYILSIGNKNSSGAFASIPARQYANFLVRLRQYFCDISDKRCLAGPARRDVSDADRTRAERVRLENASVVK